MRYDENEELEATGEWLLRFNGAGFSEELMYVPSRLFRLGVAPIDVIDRLDWLRENDHDADGSDHDTVEIVEESPVLDYDGYGAWEWVEPVEKMVEDSILAIFNSEPGLHEFNELAALARPKKRTRGKRSRAVHTVEIPNERVNELVRQ